MSSISIRGVSDELAAVLKEQARKANKSVNQFILETLRSSVGLDKNLLFTKQYHDLDHLFGKWNEDEFANIQQSIDSQRSIDEELWG